MKTLRKIDLESMRKELQVLESYNLREIQGGRITPSYDENGNMTNNWACVFNWMEYNQKAHQGGGTPILDAEDYYESFKEECGYDPMNSGGI